MEYVRVDFSEEEQAAVEMYAKSRNMTAEEVIRAVMLERIEKEQVDAASENAHLMSTKANTNWLMESKAQLEDNRVIKWR